MERTTQLFTPERDYLNRTMTFRWRRGEFRVGIDGQIVDVATHLTLCNSNDAHAWIEEYAHKQDRALATRATRPPSDHVPSAIDDIALRKNIYRGFA